MKKKLISIFSVLLILLVVTFSGCGTARPHEIKWYLSDYYIIGERYYHFVGFDNYDHFNSTFSDQAQISFKGDGTFYFKDFAGVEYEGTYKSKKASYGTDVTLTLPDGTTAEGSYWKYDYEGIYYSGRFEIYGVNYYFDDAERHFDRDKFEKCLKNLTGAINTFANDGKMEIEHYPYYENLKRAVIDKIGERFIMIAGNSAYILNNCEYWCYTFGSDEIVKCELQEGNCIVRDGNGRFAIYYPEIQ